MIGQTLGHYRIDAKLGEGGMGVVYKARDTQLDRSVAIKVLPTGRVEDPERKRRFVQEAKAASALNHPNIVHIYGIDTASAVDFIAMEYVEGSTLAELIGRKGFKTTEAFVILGRKLLRVAWAVWKSQKPFELAILLPRPA